MAESVACGQRVDGDEFREGLPQRSQRCRRGHGEGWKELELKKERREKDKERREGMEGMKDGKMEGRKDGKTERRREGRTEGRNRGRVTAERGGVEVESGELGKPGET